MQYLNVYLVKIQKLMVNFPNTYSKFTIKQNNSKITYINLECWQVIKKISFGVRKIREMTKTAAFDNENSMYLSKFSDIESNTDLKSFFQKNLMHVS